MSDWRSIVSEYYERYFADQGSLVLGQPATVEDLDLLDKKTGIRMPPEFRSFYSELNGFGIDRDGETEWFFVHTSEIPNLTADTRSWIEETHPEVAKRYIAVVNGTGIRVGIFSQNLASRSTDSSCSSTRATSSRRIRIGGSFSRR